MTIFLNSGKLGIEISDREFKKSINANNQKLKKQNRGGRCSERCLKKMKQSSTKSRKIERLDLERINTKKPSSHVVTMFFLSMRLPSFTHFLPSVLTRARLPTITSERLDGQEMILLCEAHPSLFGVGELIDPKSIISSLPSILNKSSLYY